MTYFIIFCILLLIIVGISYYAYRVAFLALKRTVGEHYHLPQGEQYETQLGNIQKWIDEMLAMPFEKIYITSHDGKQLYGRYYHIEDQAPIQIFPDAGHGLCYLVGPKQYEEAMRKFSQKIL